MLRKVLLFSVVVLGSLLLVATVVADADHCVNPDGSDGCFASIQAAVDAAAPGDTIEIEEGTYFENVDVNKAGVTLIGAEDDDVVIDADDPNTGNGIDVLANDVTIENLAIHNGDLDGIEVSTGVTGTVITEVTIIGPDDECIDINGNDTLVEDSTLLGCGDDSIDAVADNVSILDNKINIADNDCVFISGNNALVSGNEISLCEDGIGVDVNGDNATVTENDIFTTDDEGIEIRGANADVSDNSLKHIGEVGIEAIGDNANISDNEIHSAYGPGIDVIGDIPTITDNIVVGMVGSDDNISVDCANSQGNNCNGGEVSGNEMSDAPGDTSCLHVDADVVSGTFVVADNSCKRAANYAFNIEGDGIHLLNNKAEDGGGDQGEAAFYITGTNHVLEGNSAKNWRSYGFDIRGNGHTLSENEAIENYGDGFTISGNNVTLTDNVAEDNIADGFEVESNADGTMLLNNEGSGNRLDFCDAGTNTNGGAAENDFETVGPCADIE